MTNSANHLEAQKSIGQPAAEQDWLLIGRIVGAHGLNGHVKVHPESDFPERFTVPGERWLKKSHSSPSSQPTPIRLTSGRYLEGKKQYLVKLEGIDYRDQAEDLKQAELLVPESDRLDLEPGEFHVSDLIGLTVIMQADQTTVGTVRNVFTTGHDMLEVVLAHEDETMTVEQPIDELPQPAPQPEESHPSTRATAAQKLRRKAKKKRKKQGPKTLLIPFVEEIVPMVDLTAGQIEITPPPGLIEL